MGETRRTRIEFRPDSEEPPEPLEEKSPQVLGEQSSPPPGTCFKQPRGPSPPKKESERFGNKVRKRKGGTLKSGPSPAHPKESDRFGNKVSKRVGP